MPYNLRSRKKGKLGKKRKNVLTPVKKTIKIPDPKPWRRESPVDLLDIPNQKVLDITNSWNDDEIANNITRKNLLKVLEPDEDILSKTGGSRKRIRRTKKHKRKHKRRKTRKQRYRKKK